jgi:YYY domain-containing protein
VRHLLAWAATVEVLGLATLPLARALFRNRRDAALLSRLLGLALVAYVGWLLSLAGLPFSRLILLAALALLALFCWKLFRGAVDEDPRLWGAPDTLGALLFWGCTAIFLVIRAFGPEVLGAEKFMDLAFFNSITRGEAMPPADPWMVGKTINYYYWGYLLAAIPAKLSAVTPYVAYNLALATFAGFSFAAAACIGLRLSGGSLGAGVGAGVATVFAGNVVGALDAWKAPFAPGFDYWHASRVIGAGDTINEFPFFTFFHADLHPHLLAFPYFIAAFAVAHRFIEMGRPAPSETQGGKSKEKSPRLAEKIRRAAPAALLVFVAGTAIAANKWNTPAMAILLVASGALRPSEGRWLAPLRELVPGAFRGAVLLLAALIAWWPYSSSYELPYRGIGRTSATSGMFEFLGVWGILLAVSALALWPRRAENAPVASKGALEGVSGSAWLAVAVAASWLLALLTKTPVLVLLLPLVYLAVRAAAGARGTPESGRLTFTCFMLLLAAGMILGCEVIHFKDNYGEKLHRMNTIFKFYHQAWPLLACAAVVLAERAWSAWGHRSRAFRAAIAVAAFLALLYPLNAAISRMRQRQGPLSLDARGPLARRSPGDAAAIAWLEKNAPRGSVVMEATGDPYSDFARVASHTGIPTVLGWANHEGLWRSNDREVAERESLVRRFYESSDVATALAILRRFGVTYVVVGDLERRRYPAAADVSFLPFLQPVYNGATTVYRVVGTS